jgi:hypothetical protein
MIEDTMISLTVKAFEIYDIWKCDYLLAQRSHEFFRTDAEDYRHYQRKCGVERHGNLEFPVHQMA